MKKVMVLLFMVGCLSFALLPWANAATTTGAIAVVADIKAGTPDIVYEIHKMDDGNPDNDPWTNYTTASSLTFDKWDVIQRTGKAAQWVSTTQNTIIIWASGNGDDYQITSVGSGALTGPGGTLPQGSFMVVPIYSEKDKWAMDLNGDGDTNDPGEKVEQGPKPTTATLGTKGPGFSANKSIYSSESPVGSARIIQALYMFPAYNLDGSEPWTGMSINYAPIPTTTAAGTYSGATVTINIVAKG